MSAMKELNLPTFPGWWWSSERIPLRISLRLVMMTLLVHLPLLPTAFLLASHGHWCGQKSEGK